MLLALLGEKNLVHLAGESAVATYRFSYSERPPSCREGSLGTPCGLHQVADKIGDGAPHGMIFRGRVATGECWQDREDAGPAQRNFVTTRILRLRGLEEGLNAGPGVDSYDRYIYIHGTNHPGRFPDNISHGCLLMQDEDLLRLFDAVPERTHVFISPPEAGPPT